MTIKTVGLDLAKDVFQVHGISESGRVIFNKAINRTKLLAFFKTLPPCTVGMETCSSSHHWGRQLRKFGHDVRLMPANYVKPYVKRGKPLQRSDGVTETAPSRNISETELSKRRG